MKKEGKQKAYSFQLNLHSSSFFFSYPMLKKEEKRWTVQKLQLRKNRTR